MQKTKLGISVGLMGAAVYFLALTNFLGLILIAGFILLFETNEWLKWSAVKAVAIVIGFALINVIVGFGNDIFQFINNFFALVKSTIRVIYPLRLDGFISTFISATQKLVLFILGIKALSQGSITVKPIDKLIKKNM